MTSLQFDRDGHVARLTINRPERRNALDPETKLAFSDALDRIEADDDIWLAVITGTGDQAFCAGRDLKHTALMSTQPAADQAASRALEQRARTLQARPHFAKPVIARVNGSALGGGLELAMACDIIVCADHAELGLPEPKRGLIAGGGGVHRLPRQIGLKQAMGYLLTGRHMSAERAYQLGLVNDVAPTESLDEVVNGWVEDILACAPLSVRATKEMATRGLEQPLSDALTLVTETEKLRRSSQDTVEGPRAFAEKRAPRWQGR